MKPDFAQFCDIALGFLKEGANKMLKGADRALEPGKWNAVDCIARILMRGKKFDRERFVIFCGRSGFIDRVLQDIGRFFAGENGKRSCL